MDGGIFYPKPLQVALTPIEVGVFVMVVAWVATLLIAHQNNQLLRKLLARLDCFTPQ